MARTFKVKGLYLGDSARNAIWEFTRYVLNSRLGVEQVLQQPKINAMSSDKQSYLPIEDAEPRGHYIYRPWITDPVTGKRKYPRHAKVFKIWVSEG